MKKYLIAVNVHQECYAYLFYYRLIYVMCLKYPPLTNMQVLRSECHWRMDATILHISMLCQTFIFITEM